MHCDAIDFVNFGEADKLYGFTPHAIKDLAQPGGTSRLRREQGVYVVYTPKNFVPNFLPEKNGFLFRGKPAFIPLDVLEAKWVEGMRVIYIGKAGGSGKKATLYSRLNAYIRFGQRKGAAHWGGRHIWQLGNIMQCFIAEMPLTADVEPSTLETALIKAFRKQNNEGRLPFANRKS